VKRWGVLWIACAGCYTKPPAPDLDDPCAPGAVIPAQITLSGTLSDDQTSTTRIMGVGVHAEPGYAVTNASGAFAIDHTTDGIPWATSLSVDPTTGYPPHRFYYARPFIASSTLDEKLIAELTLAGLYTQNGHTYTTAAATALVRVENCRRDAIAGLSIESSRSGDVRHLGGGQSTDATSGAAFVLDAEPGDTTFTAGTSSIDVTIAAGTVTVVRMLHD
jgi:hypothetical protein